MYVPKSEILTHNVTFDVFREKVVMYVSSELKNAKNILSAVRNINYPLTDLRERSGPKKETDEQKKN